MELHHKNPYLTDFVAIISGLQSSLPNLKSAVASSMEYMQVPILMPNFIWWTGHCYEFPVHTRIKNKYFRRSWDISGISAPGSFVVGAFFLISPEIVTLNRPRGIRISRGSLNRTPHHLHKYHHIPHFYQKINPEVTCPCGFTQSVVALIST